MHRQETLVATVTYLLVMLSPLRLRMKRLYLDRGFYSVPVDPLAQSSQYPLPDASSDPREIGGHSATVRWT
ncbi:hypothetical protein [Leptolyngbya sp. FACHB-16]|uniref:hypothetical protein n=1 Tax=unclassified Leptolyngbya TaxID=2650499 RepID=UPI0019A064AA|nr:hypothetical protein [Leptolyngbya sp. FACHB-16]MBD2157665.1 hypothetical protein [Leptolyngbya sp. FACHB-16]